MPARKKKPRLSPIRASRKEKSAYHVNVVPQLSIFMANQAGAFTRLCELMTVEGIHIEALTIADTIDYAVIRMVVDDPHLALRFLEDHGLLVLQTEVIVMEGWGEWNDLCKISKVLAEAKVNIEYIYFTSMGKRGVLVLRPSNILLALKALNQYQPSI